MSYSSPAQYRSFVDRLTTDGARSSLQWGRAGTEQDGLIQLALDAAENDLNTAGDQGGYTTPFTQLGLGITPEKFVGALAMLQQCEMAIASRSNPFPIDSTPMTKETWELCQMRIKKIRDGTGLPSGEQGPGGFFEFVPTEGTPIVNFTQIFSHLRVPNP